MENKTEIYKQYSTIPEKEYKRMQVCIKEGFSFVKIVNKVKYVNRTLEDIVIIFEAEKVRFLQFKVDNYLINKIKHFKQEEKNETGQSYKINQ